MARTTVIVRARQRAGRSTARHSKFLQPASFLLIHIFRTGLLEIRGWGRSMGAPGSHPTPTRPLQAPPLRCIKQRTDSRAGANRRGETPKPRMPFGEVTIKHGSADGASPHANVVQQNSLRHHGCQNGLLTSRHRSVDESPISRNWTLLSVARNARSLILACHCPSRAAHRLSDAEASERPLFAFVFMRLSR